jgi:VWFA-related protein
MGRGPLIAMLAIVPVLAQQPSFTSKVELVTVPSRRLSCATIVAVMRYALTPALLIAATFGVTAQQPEFKAGVELVSVPVTVTSLDHNTYIEGLTAADFRVSENGERQVVTTVTRVRRPLSLCLVIDSSGSMLLGTRRNLAVEASERLVEGLQPDDEVSIVLFGEDIVDNVLPWTRKKDIAKLDFSKWRPRGNTPLNDGMRVGLEMIEKAGNNRHAVVLITDGFENASRESTSSLVKSRRQSETTVYGIGVGSANLADLRSDAPRLQTPNGFGQQPANADALRRQEAIAPGASEQVRGLQTLPFFDYLETLVGDSGGSVSRGLSFPEITMAARNITAELNYEYLIGYTPTKPLDGKYRKIKVELNKRGVYVRHRGGYLALSSQAPGPKPQDP